MAELEESRRKLVVLQLQRHGGLLMNTSSPNAVNGGVSTDKSSDKSMCWQDLKDAVEEAKVLVIRPVYNFVDMDVLYMPYLLTFYLILLFFYLLLLICPMEGRP